MLFFHFTYEKVYNFKKQKYKRRVRFRASVEHSYKKNCQEPISRILCLVFKKYSHIILQPNSCLSLSVYKFTWSHVLHWFSHITFKHAYWVYYPLIIWWINNSRSVICLVNTNHSTNLIWFQTFKLLLEIISKTIQIWPNS